VAGGAFAGEPHAAQNLALAGIGDPHRLHLSCRLPLI
jgi:hypothetical protein